jgi:DNA primase
VYLALDADSSGQEAMLKATKIAEARGLSLRVIELPEGRDPAELIAEDGDQAFSERIEGALSVLQFAVRRVLAEADLSRPEGVDRALEQARALIARAPERSAVRDDLITLVAERLEVPFDYVVPGPNDRPPPEAPPGPDEGPPSDERPAPPERTPMTDGERRFLGLCLAAGAPGREFLERIGPDHLSSEAVRRAHKHLMDHFDDPLKGIDQDDNDLSVLVAEIAVRGEDGDPPDGAALRMGFLQLDLRRIERQVRTALKDGDLDRQRVLAGERQRVRTEMDTAMGQAT